MSLRVMTPPGLRLSLIIVIELEPILVGPRLCDLPIPPDSKNGSALCYITYRKRDKVCRLVSGRFRVVNSASSTSSSAARAAAIGPAVPHEHLRGRATRVWWLLPSSDAHDSGGVTSALPSSWIEIEYLMEEEVDRWRRKGLMEGSKPPRLSFTGRNAKMETIILRVYSVRVRYCRVDPVSICSISTGERASGPGSREASAIADNLTRYQFMARELDPAPRRPPRIIACERRRIVATCSIEMRPAGAGRYRIMAK
ncbi:hypothetical protein EVAR_81249_1 [Eumeta japonica]|uniref:Uncharacterized protein n=1 Tax=Eumeta variegata TaxID=151549 RepID=A0A4C1WS42_EUMVA|nr:hypothetical protein EVAR_81249_1 [Eumeta japonica]